MKIALLSPKGPLYHHRTGIFRKDLRAAPLTLTTLAALIPPDLRATVSIHDEGVEEIPETLDADLIGMTVITGSAPRSYELAARYRAQNKTVILGGPHVTLAPEDALPHADSIVTGYAEETWPQLLADYAEGCLKPRYDMSPAFSFHTLANLPFPERALRRARGYKVRHTFEATRGCIHTCEFCVVPSAWGRRPFQKPIDHVIADIRRSGAKRAIFYDLNLFADFVYAKELLRALTKLRVSWFGLGTVLIGKDSELLELIGRSNCAGLLIGFESLSEQSLRSFGKAFNAPSQYGALLKSLRDLGILVNGTFVFGSDHDDEQAFDAVEDFVEAHRVALPRFSILTPFPGTPLYRRLDAENRITDRDWSRYDGQHVVFQPAGISAQSLARRHEAIWRRVYRLRSIRRRLAGVRRNAALAWGANLAYRYYGRNLSNVYNCRGGAW